MTWFTRTRIRNWLIALGLLTVFVPVARYVIICEGHRDDYRFRATNARRAASFHWIRMPDGQYQTDPGWEQAAQKWERAARFPWLPLGSDPPRRR